MATKTESWVNFFLVKVLTVAVGGQLQILKAVRPVAPFYVSNQRRQTTFITSQLFMFLGFPWNNWGEVKSHQTRVKEEADVEM